MPENTCSVTNIGGFLKNLCFDSITEQYYHKCAHSNVAYEVEYGFHKDTGDYTIRSVSSVCDNDPHVYQGCGFSTVRTKNTDHLCGGYFKDTEPGENRFIACDQGCDRDILKNTAAQTSTRRNNPTDCNDVCAVSYTHLTLPTIYSV